MNRILQATYHDGSLVLDKKLDAALEGRRITLMLVDDPADLQLEPQQTNKRQLEPREKRFLEQLQQHSFELPENYRFSREELYDR